MRYANPLFNQASGTVIRFVSWSFSASETTAIIGVSAAHAALFALLCSFDTYTLPQPLTVVTGRLISAELAAPQRQAVNAKKEISPLPPSALERKPPTVPASVTSLPARKRAASPATSENGSHPAESKESEISGGGAASVANVAGAAEMPARFDVAFLHNRPPAYPALSRRMGEEGKVVLRVFVSYDGRPKQIELKTSSGSPRLDVAAQSAVAHWRFVPAKRGETALASWVLVPIVFSLKD